MRQFAEYSSVVSGTDRLADAVSKWAERSGARTAVRAFDGVLSFAELEDRTRMLTGKLAAEGVGPQTSVGLLLGRSRLGLPALLAVWSLGATAVLIDERHPVDRVNFLLRDAGAQLLLADQLPAGAAPRRVRTISSEVTGAQPADPVTPNPDDCAYMVYTSGTTGWPKGVEVTYRNLGIFLDALASLELEPGGMGVNAVSPAFDGWLWCTLLYLLHGQGMAVIDLAAEEGSGDLSALVAEHEPTTVCLTPTLVSALEPIPAADVVVVAGEPCPPSLLPRLSHVPRVLNVYGPTETTIAATWADSAHGDDPATIGRALPGYLTYVLDGNGRPVERGTEGELYVGGPAVARGYCNRPSLTEQRFLPDPFLGGDARMYRTGDLVRERADGQLEFRGRDDEQVKVRGFRVEVGELERAAQGIDAVQAAAAYVMSNGDSLGLAVTTAPGTDQAECTKQVREHCASRLPDFMVPSAVEVVSVLPALPTGKIDRAELARTSRVVTTGQAPGTEREHQVCEVWSSLLPHPVHDVTANFFELGGHSLLAARAVGALRRRTGLPVSVKHLLAEPTVAALARELDLLALAQSGDS
ncbi:amino acid adenylation domain-containing protein [Saccharopolyspora erythraea NRRL 2338]|nr:non-ribosomal peptide synthetase [Saccharopolyspora erythraea]PFG97849.1 amino acid adenylation domain-containing protein [Saccharopolyspora erythraea NRRL 2338]